jgi:hypothetical protein
VWLLGIGRGVPGEECVWKDGGGEEGTDGARIDGVCTEETEETELGSAVL